MPQHDVIIVGGGFAGLRAALSAKAAGVNVAVVSKTHPMRSHSCGAHSGINAATMPDDSWGIHAQDTIRAGGFLNNQDAVEELCKNAREDVISLEHMGVIFNRDSQGKIDVMRFAGASQPRTCFVGDSAGHVILQVLYEQIVRAEIPIYDDWLVSSLIMEDGKCQGVLARDHRTGSIEPFYGKAIVLATGNLGRMYAPSTSSLTATADGIGLAYRVGASLMDMEMVQFHPTTLPGRGLLITEAARGLNAYLVNKEGDRFMSSVSPDSMELAPRDVCSRAVAREILDGRGEDGNVFLDMRHIGKDVIHDRLRETGWLLDDLDGLNPTESLVPVRPAMHRPMGGVETDINGSTSIKGLYAAGECACAGTHGANRLGGNSLLECVVFGRRAGESASRYSSNIPPSSMKDSLVKDETQRLRNIADRKKDQDSAGIIRRSLAEVMNSDVGIFRDEKGLQNAKSAVSDLKARWDNIGVNNAGSTYNMELTAIIELGFMLDAAEVTIESALARQETRGAHYRIDFPERDDDGWQKHVVATYSPDGPKLENKPVVVTHWKQGEVC